VQRSSTLASILTLVLSAACGGGGGDPADARPQVDAGPDDPRPDRVGLINVIEGGGFNSIYASIADGPEVPALAHVATHGECAIHARPEPAQCDPPCTTGACTAPDVCTPYPEPVDHGDITVTGLNEPLVFVPGEFGYAPDPFPSGADLFDAGDPIAVSAPGAAGAAFAADLVGVEALVAPAHNLTLVDGEDAIVTWTAGAGATEIELQLVVGWHGAPPEAVMTCITADDGSFTIPGAAITDLPRASSSLESHASALWRFDRAVVEVAAGPIEIVVASNSTIFFGHP
jgi:hypothetical protein